MIGDNNNTQSGGEGSKIIEGKAVTQRWGEGRQGEVEVIDISELSTRALTAGSLLVSGHWSVSLPLANTPLSKIP